MLDGERKVTRVNSSSSLYCIATWLGRSCATLSNQPLAVEQRSKVDSCGKASGLRALKNIS
jgi:hypothetical protein